MRSLKRPLPVRYGWSSPLARGSWSALALLAGLAIALLPLPVAGVWVAGLVILLGVLIEPLAGLVLTLLAGPFGALENIVLGASSFDSGQLMLLLSLAAWLLHNLARRQLRLPRIAPAVALTWLLFLVIAAGSVLVAAPSLVAGLKELAKWLQLGLVAWFVADLSAPGARGSRRQTWAVAAVLLAGLSQALIGIWQFGLRGHGPEHFGILGRFYRAYGTFEQPNPFAGFLGLTLPLAIGLAIGILGRRGNPIAWLRRFKLDREAILLLLALLTAGILALAILMSWSRGGWLGAAAGAVAILFFLPRKRWVGAVLVLLLLVFGLGALFSGLVPASIASRLTGFTDYVQFQDVRGVDTTPENYAVLERMAHWQAAINMADAHPWLGVGFGNYEPAYSEYALINWPYPLGHAHNYYLNLLAEVGILGLLSYLAFWGAVIWLTARVIRRVSYPQRGIALGLMGVWTHLSVHHLVDKLYVNNIYLHLGALVGILLLLDQENHDRTD